MFDKEVHPELCRRILRNNDFHSRVPRKKPYINAVNHKKDWLLQKPILIKIILFWDKVIFSDESKFNIFGSDGQNYEWRKPNTKLEIPHLRETVKRGGGSLMAWECMTASDTRNLIFIDGILDKYKYLNILKNKESARKLGLLEDFHFQRDNDSKHTARIMKECYSVDVTPPQSPDINPIENLWVETGKRWNKFHIISKEVLKDKIIEIWNLSVVLQNHWYTVCNVDWDTLLLLKVVQQNININ